VGRGREEKRKADWWKWKLCIDVETDGVDEVYKDRNYVNCKDG
jgi:hypothetical protein